MSRIKHTTLSNEHFYVSLTETMNETIETRQIVLLLHLYLEYVINEGILKLFVHGEDLLELNFFKKLEILKATGVLDNHQDIFENISKINSIRNYYAHTLILNEVEQIAIKQVKEMTFIGKKEIPSNFDFKDELKLKSIETIIELQNLFYSNNSIKKE